MNLTQFARFWTIAFLICAAAGAIVLRPDRALGLYLTLRNVAPSGPILSNHALALEGQTTLKSTEPEAEAPDPAHAQNFRKGIARRRTEARQHLVIFGAIALLAPTLLSLIALTVARLRRETAQ
ncbi:MAG: hypothetical protein ACREDI_11155 [Roseiarcus sp.]